MTWLKFSPSTIVEVGTHAGSLANVARKTFGDAKVELIGDALTRPRTLLPWRRLPAPRDGELSSLPLADGSAELLLSNLDLARYTTPDTALAEIARVLRPGGACVMATLGPDSLRELREAWATVDAGAHVMEFIDMHDLGEALMRHGLGEPVLDVERLSLTYADVGRLWQDLQLARARGVLPARQSRGLTTPAQWARMTDALAARSRPVQITIEIVYLQAWRQLPRDRTSETRISPSQISKRV
ncbi:MAG: methyltransferase domain-containing protein [Pseudomonadota bacterium]